MNRNCALNFVMGISVGVGLAMILAPKPGEKTRKDLTKKAQDATSYLRDQGTGIRQSATEMAEKAKREVNRHKQGLASALDAGKAAYKRQLG
jgi:gas vesicle protein